jgi:hypothetical protein
LLDADATVWCRAGLQQRFQFPFNDWLKGSKIRQEIKAAVGAAAAAAAAARLVLLAAG